MAFTTGSSTRLAAEINITPMIDILLVLLIVFMVLRSFAPEGEQALIPQPPARDAKELQPERTIVVQLLPGSAGRSRLTINQDPVSWEELPARIHDIYKQRAEKIIFVKGNADIDFSDVAEVIDVAHNDGIDKVGLITAKIENGVGE